jgi:hypothetical protein
VVLVSLAVALTVGSTGCSSGSSSGSVVSDSGGDVAVDVLMVCPSQLPPDGGTCAPNFLTCEYGGTPHHACNTTAVCLCDTCGGPGWGIQPLAPGCGQNAASCPGSYGTGENGACPVQSTCDYAEGRCGCLSCTLDGGPGTEGGITGAYWHCRPWNDPGIGAGCPSLRPLLGTPCSLTEGTTCDYGQCCGGPSLGPSLECSGGIWREYVNGGCACALRYCP